MCEIAVLDPERTDDQSIHQLASTFFEEQGDGLGILSIQSDEETFTYDAYRHSEPDWFQFHKFLNRTRDETWRYVLHGRSLTNGKAIRDNAHPIPIDCPKCDSEWVIHNGSVRSHKEKRGGLTSQGHTFSSNVDTEVIAHTISELPDSTDDLDDETYNLKGNLNYLLFSEDKIFCRLAAKYYVTDDFVVSCRTRRTKNPISTDYEIEIGQNKTQWFVIEPDFSIDSKENDRGNVHTASSTTQSAYRSQSASSGSSASSRSGDTVTVEYEDLVPRLKNVKAYRVAPGVIRVDDQESTHEEYVHRRDAPGLYYYYATDENPSKDQIAMQELFSGDGELRDAQDIETYTRVLGLAMEHGGDEDVAEAALEASQTTLDAIAERETEAMIDSESGTGNGIYPDVDHETWEFAYDELMNQYGNAEKVMEEMAKMDDKAIRMIAKQSNYVLN